MFARVGDPCDNEGRDVSCRRSWRGRDRLPRGTACGLIAGVGDYGAGADQGPVALGGPDAAPGAAVIDGGPASSDANLPLPNKACVRTPEMDAGSWATSPSPAVASAPTLVTFTDRASYVNVSLVACTPGSGTPAVLNSPIVTRDAGFVSFAIGPGSAFSMKKPRLRWAVALTRAR